MRFRAGTAVINETAEDIATQRPRENAMARTAAARIEVATIVCGLAEFVWPEVTDVGDEPVVARYVSRY
jgi:hypothetical protein